MSAFDHRAIDATWQQFWDAEQIFKASSDHSKPKYYVLDMFPYPSGSGLHVGHPKGYVATDVVARAKRMQGFNVLRVMGWDSFGLPAERQAVREGKHPRDITTRNVATFKSQLTKLGLSYDWNREFATSDKSYYKWTQWIFLKLYEKGLAYQADVPVNWCPALGTVLANEEVKDGKYIETGDDVERRVMKQWMLRITEYAESLLAGLEDVDWPHGIKKMQSEWIGKSIGAEVSFPVVDSGDDVVKVFTTRPDTLFGASYVVLAPEHPLVARITSAEAKADVEAYVTEVSKRSERDRTSASVDAKKTGVFTGAYAINPVNQKKIPIWITDYVLATYGTGAVFACPAHDERDHAFAKQFGLPIVEVVKGGDVTKEPFLGDGPHVNSDFLDGLKSKKAKERIIEFLEQKNSGQKQINYRLRDWLFSRQRYWGEPFPMVQKSDGSMAALPESSLPVTLPDLSEYKPTQDGDPPLARAKDWVKTVDPASGEPALRETNTMPQWAGSCWYYLRFVSPDRDDVAWDPSDEKYWMPVDLYVGGAEHATLHLLYARFWHHVLYDLGLVSTREPFKKLFNQGMVHARSFREESGKYRYPSEVEARGDSWVVKGSGAPVTTRLEKMSKSRYNVVNPDDMCETYGADALRLYELFMGPLEDGCEWETGGVSGTRRFLDRLWRLVVDEESGSLSTKLVESSVEDADLERALHATLKKVSEDLAELKFNTAIAEMMSFVNVATKAKQVPRGWVEDFIKVVAPFAPHLAEEIWQRLGHSSSVTLEAWPEYDGSKLTKDTIELAVQIGGKMRGTIEVDANIAKDDAFARVKKDDRFSKYLDGKTVRREIYVPGRLVNLVVS